MMTKVRKACGSIAGRLAPAAAELKLRQQAAFERLYPSVQKLKSSPSVRVTVAATVTALALAGQWRTAAGLALAWFAAKPITHIVAGGVGAVSMLDQRRHGESRHKLAVQPAAPTELPAALVMSMMEGSAS